MDTNKCSFCDTPYIDTEMYTTFNIKTCRDCKRSIKLITKTTALKEYLLTNEDLNKLNFITRPNPHKGNWHDMCLYMEEEVKKVSMNKFENEETLEKVKEERKEIIKNRKIKNIKKRIRDLKRRTFVDSVCNKEEHVHEFVGTDGNKVCSCGMEIEQEEI